MSRAAPPRGAEDKRARAGGTDAIACSEGSDGTPCVPTDFKVDECEPRHADRGSSRGHEDRGGGKGARQPDHPVHRGGRDRHRHHAGNEGSRRRRRPQGLRQLAPDPLARDLRGCKGDTCVRERRLATRGDPQGRTRLQRVDQGSADDADRRRHPLAERRAAPGARPLRLPPPSSILPGGAKPAARSDADEHGHLPGEQRGHLRGHRVGGRDRGRPQGHRLSAGRDGGAQDPLPGDLEHRDQAGVARGDRAARPQGDPVRARQRATRR